MRWQTGVTRRTLLRNTAVGTAALAAGAIGAHAQPASKPPNIVFILADDLGYADVSCYGRPDFSTPNIDRLAARGVRFLQAYANSAVCTATRVALMTGRYQYRWFRLVPSHSQSGPGILHGYSQLCGQRQLPGQQRVQGFHHYQGRNHAELHGRYCHRQ